MKIRTKFKNSRRFSTSPPVVARKVACKASEKLVEGLPQYNASPKVTSLEAERLRNALLEEVPEDDRRMMLKATLGQRRRAVVVEKKTIRRIRDTFPYMFGSEEVKSVHI